MLYYNNLQLSTTARLALNCLDGGISFKEYRDLSSAIEFDNRRIIANGDMHYLAMNKTDAESGTGFSHVDPVDFMSNGFRVMNADAWMNTVNRKYIFMAFAQHPFVSSGGVPCTAR